MVVVCVTKTERGTQMAKKRANGEGNIRKRKDGRWEGRYTAGVDPETGKPIAKSVLARTQRECKEKLQKAMEELEKIDITKRRDYTVGEWAQLWYGNYAKPSVRASTAAYYKNYIDQHIVPRIGDIKLTALTTLQIQKFYNETKAHGRVQRYEKMDNLSLSNKTIRGLHTMLRQCLEQAVTERLIPYNPANGCRLPKKEKKKIGLTTKIFIALLAGAIFGIILCYAVPSGHIKDDIIVEGVLYVVGQGFIKLMKMLVVPLVFCSLVCGSMSIGDTKKLGTVGARTLIFYLATTALAVTVALSVGNLINPGVGLDMSTIKTNAASVETMKATSLTDTLLNIIPDNPINSLASGEMLQIIVFALIIGVILAKLGERAETVANFFSQFNDIMMEMTMMIMALAPIGVFCLISRTFANIGFSAFVPLAKYMIGVLIALAIQCFGVYQILLKIFTGLNPIRFIKKFFPVMAFAFSTATSNATIPMSIDTLSKKVGVSKKISSFTIPLGATINMDGTSIMQGVAVVFAAQAFGIHLTPMDYVTVIGTATLASVGTAGVPSVGLVTLTMVFNSVGLPVEAIGLIMGIDRILDMTRTAVNITGDAVCTTIVAHQNGALDKKVFNETE